MSPSDLLMWIQADRGLQALWDQRSVTGSRILLAVLRAVLKVTTSERSANTISVLTTFRDCNFFKEVSSFINSVPYVDCMYVEAVECLLDLLDILMERLPSDSKDVVSLILLVVKSKAGSLPASVISKVDKINEKVQHFKDARGISKPKQAAKTPVDDDVDFPDDGEPPDDFRTLSIFPTAEDFAENEVFLRRNIVDGPYKDVNTYLDVQFRLNREDFVRPLREGIQEYKKCLRLGQKIKNKDIRIYEQTKILSADVTNDGLVYQIQINMEAGLKNIRWENSKRLIYGSLVCLSRDGFNSFLFATVANRDNDKLKDGIISVSIETNTEIDFSASYTMVESSSYFESYRHVLKSLQRIGAENLPFERYIVGEQPDTDDNDNFLVDVTEKQKRKVVINNPRYLRNADEVKYDLTPLVKKKFRKLGQEVDIRFDSKWPNKADTYLDDSQYDAVMNALTREVSIIQGPPGTGKTFIGLKIAEVLLKNNQLWNRRERPILVLCYTNHALDQFLEGILKFNNKIVRVGSRSKNPALEDYNVSQLKRKKSEEYSRDLRANFAKIRGQMNDLTEMMTWIGARIEATRTHVLNEDELEDYMGSAVHLLYRRAKHLSSGDGCQTSNKQSSLIGDWLGLGRTLDEEDIVADDLANLNMDDEVVDEEEKQEEAENIDIEEDAQHELKRRLLDIDEPSKDIVDQLMQNKERAMKNVGVVDIEESQKSGGWQITKKEKKRRMKKMKAELNKETMMNGRERREAEAAPHNLSMNERWRLYRTWVLDYIQNQQDVYNKYRNDYIHEILRLKEIKEMETGHILKQSKVITLIIINQLIN